VRRICIAASSLEALQNGHRSGPGHRLTFLRMPGVNRQGQAHITSTASRLRSIDPQPASISPTINISIVFICAFFVDCGQIICCPAIKNDSSASTLKRACRMCAEHTGTFAALGACATRARRVRRFTVVASCTSYTSYTGQMAGFSFRYFRKNPRDVSAAVGLFIAPAQFACCFHFGK
jgi:hypothetical protein